MQRMTTCSPVAFNDIKRLARSMPADDLEAQDLVPDIFVAAIGFLAKHTRSRAPSLAALPVITWRSRLVTVMAGPWSSRSSLSDQRPLQRRLGSPRISPAQS